MGKAHEALDRCTKELDGRQGLDAMVYSVYPWVKTPESVA
jgi:hypothetical protein